MIHREGKNIEGKNVEGDDVFLVAGPSRVSKGAFSDSLKKIKGPGNVSHSAPPSPSPPPRVLEHHVSDVSKTTQMADELQFPPIPTELSAGAPSGQPHNSSQPTGPNNEGPQLAAPFPDQQCSGYPTVDATQHLIAGNGYLVPTGSNYPQAQPYPQPFFGARPGYLGMKGQSVYQGGNMNVPGVYQSGNANAPGVYQGAIAGGNTNVPGIYQAGNMNGFAAYHGGNMNGQGVYADTTGQQYFPNLAGLGAATLPTNLPVPPHPQGRPPSRG